MGKGNFMARGTYATQWFVDYDNYRVEDDYGGDTDDLALEDDVEWIMNSIQEKFPSFKPVDRRDNSMYGRYWDCKIKLENKLFRIGIADNEWSYAVYIELNDEYDYKNLAGTNYAKYIIFITQFFYNTGLEVYLRNGAWMSTPLRRSAA